MNLRQQFFTEMLRLAHVTQTDNWDEMIFALEERHLIDVESGARWLDFFVSHQSALEGTMHLLGDAQSRTVLWALLLYRVLGHHHVRMPLNTESYQEKRTSLDQYVVEKG